MEGHGGSVPGPGSPVPPAPAQAPLTSRPVPASPEGAGLRMRQAAPGAGVRRRGAGVGWPGAGFRAEDPPSAPRGVGASRTDWPEPHISPFGDITQVA